MAGADFVSARLVVRVMAAGGGASGTGGKLDGAAAGTAFERRVGGAGFGAATAAGAGGGATGSGEAFFFRPRLRFLAPERSA